MKQTGFLTFLGLLVLVWGTPEGSQNRQPTNNGFPAPSQNNKKCSEVQIQFVQEKIGSSSIVPDSPIHDSEMEICYRGTSEPRRTSCCSRKMERRMHSASERDFYTVLRSTSSYLKDMLANHAATYQEEYVRLIGAAQNATDTVLGEVYQIPARFRYAPLEGLFTDLLAFVRRREVSVRESVMSFFDELFPLVFHYQLEDSRRTELSEDYRECLMGIRQQLTPRPFGDAPHQTAHQLTRALQFPRTFIEALHLGIETINTTDHVGLDTPCTRALTRMRYCGSCDDHVGSRPCRNFCYNVMRGCLATVTEIDRHWNEYVDAVKALATHHMRTSVDAEAVLHDLPRRISEAILHAMENGHKFYAKVIEKCGHPATSDSSAPTQGEGSKGPRLDKPIQVTTAALGVGADGRRRLHADLDTFLHSLMASKNFYLNLADTMCSADKFATGFDQDQCWNGQGLGRYNKTLVDPNLEAQMEHNPEMKVGQSQQKTMILIIDKLMHVKKLMSSKIAQDSLQADDWNTQQQKVGTYNGGGSGDGYYGYNGYNSYSPHMDDEDYEGSGGGRYNVGGSGDDRGGRRRKYGYDDDDEDTYRGSGDDYPYYNKGTRVTPQRRPGSYSSDNDFYLNNDDEDKQHDNSPTYNSNSPEQVKDNSNAPAMHIPSVLTTVIATTLTTTCSLYLWLNG